LVRADDWFCRIGVRNLKILKGRILIIPDIHQCIRGFADKILALHENEVDHIVFLGDYFDCFENPNEDENYYSFEKTCLWINEKYKSLNKAVWLIGNHDMSYISAINYKHSNPFLCSGFTKSKANTFKRKIDKEWVKSLQLCCFANGFLCSHAGFHPSYLKPYESIRETLDKYNQKVLDFRFDRDSFMKNVGQCRNGEIGVFGSPVWLDWFEEFEPIDGLNQIVGHTAVSKFSYENKGNYNLDFNRVAYGILEESGELILKIVGGENGEIERFKSVTGYS
jgi:hypothetical protein